MSHWRTSSQEAYSGYAAPPQQRTTSQPSASRAAQGMFPQLASSTLNSTLNSPSFASYSGFNGSAGFNGASASRPLTTQQQKQSPYDETLQRTKHQPNLLPALGQLSLTLGTTNGITPIAERSNFNNVRTPAQSAFANTLAAATQPLSASNGDTLRPSDAAQPPQRKKNHLTSQFQANKFAKGPRDGTFASIARHFGTAHRAGYQHWSRLEQSDKLDWKLDKEDADEMRRLRGGLDDHKILLPPGSGGGGSSKKKKRRPQQSKKSAYTESLLPRNTNDKKSHNAQQNANKPLTTLQQCRAIILDYLSSKQCRLFSLATHIIAVSDRELDDAVQHMSSNDASRHVETAHAMARQFASFDAQQRKFDSFAELVKECRNNPHSGDAATANGTTAHPSLAHVPSAVFKTEVAQSQSHNASAAPLTGAGTQAPLAAAAATNSAAPTAAPVPAASAAFVGTKPIAFVPAGVSAAAPAAAAAAPATSAFVAAKPAAAFVAAAPVAAVVSPAPDASSGGDYEDDFE